MIFNPAWSDAISSIESGGNYGILGPVTQKGDRAYGRYQVMGSNVGPWTKEVLGKAMTPQEFVNSPQAQDAVFQAKFGQSVAKYGNPQDAASVWFTGKPLAQGAGRSDILGTTGQGYVDKFNKALGQPNPVIAENAAQPVPPQAATQQAAQSAPQQPAPQGQQLPLAGMPQQQMPPQMSGLPQFNINPIAQPQPPRRVNVTGLLQLLQNAPPSVRGLLAQG